MTIWVNHYKQSMNSLISELTTIQEIHFSVHSSRYMKDIQFMFTTKEVCVAWWLLLQEMNLVIRVQNLDEGCLHLLCANVLGKDMNPFLFS